MNVRILLSLFLLTLFVIDDVNGKFGFSRGSSSRGSSSRGSSSRSGSSWSSGRGSSSGRYSTSSSSTRYGSSSGGHSTGTSSTRYGSSSGGHSTDTSSTRYGSPSGGYTTGSNSLGHGSSTGGRTTGSSPVGTSSQTSHQQNKDASTSFLHAEGGGATRPSPTSFSQPNAPYNPSQGTASSNPSWSNPHFNPSQPYPSNPTNNIGFKDYLRPTSMPVPSAPYPRPPYPTSGSNSHLPSQSFSHSNPPPYNPYHSPYNPSQTFGHPSSYPAHIPPPVPNAFGNPYSTHPVGGTYGAAGHTYYPQQHVLAQPAAQPYVPGQTVIMVPGQQNSGRGLGQMVKEALVFSTVNAGVNRLLNPYPHHVYDYNRPASSGTSETHITYNNHYFNTASSDSVSSALPNVPPGNIPITYPANSANPNPVNPSSMNPSPVNSGPVNNPVITPGVSIPTIVSNGSTTYPVNGSSVNTAGTTNNVEVSPVVLPNGLSADNTMNNKGTSNEATIYSPQYKILDDDLLMLTEELFAKQEVNISKYLTLHLQSKSENATHDAAKGQLIYVQEEVYDYPTILAIRSLYDNYEHDSTMKENRTLEKRKKEDLLLDMFLSTNVMAKAMQWLSDRGFIEPYDFDRKDTLRTIWFNTFNGATSGFERVFTSERYDTELLGVQDWIYFNYQESKNRIDYMGYVDTMKLGNKASLVKLNFQMDGIIRPNATIFVGTLPELEMSLYTICFYTRPNDLCPISLGGSKFNIFTHSFRYYGKDLIDLALPIF
ncbi:poly(U)-specific endoribonuclease homolog isoform X2 [Monomorium pharaonis]|uniref:poly(U)-specific endoribonuclease homolog isoform X2 n=1 Tax=Monomorium pharaonis TaxID=307658 RepID=UPI00174719D7|nr:poly(U)-specific endoribonuclease homolog isoform X2 [Monomorium pharaonis]